MVASTEKPGIGIPGGGTAIRAVSLQHGPWRLREPRSNTGVFGYSSLAHPKQRPVLAKLNPFFQDRVSNTENALPLNSVFRDDPRSGLLRSERVRAPRIIRRTLSRWQ